MRLIVEKEETIEAGFVMILYEKMRLSGRSDKGRTWLLGSHGRTSIRGHGEDSEPMEWP